MNCIDFRRISLEDPQRLPQDVTVHLQACHSCQGYYRELLKQERLLERALNVEVPEDLVAHTMLRHGLEQQGHDAAKHEQKITGNSLTSSWRKLVAGFALAASIVAVTLTVNFQASVNPGQIAQMLVSHVEEEAHTLQLSEPVSQGRLAYTLNNVDIQPLADLHDVTFAGNCLIEGKLAAHLVLQTEQGPVTVLLMPNNQMQAIDYHDPGGDRVQTVALQQGSMALIGPADVKLDQLRERVISAVRIHHI